MTGALTQAQIVIVGAGPAGIAASLAAANRGASVILIDEAREIGGQLSYRRNTVRLGQLGASPGRFWLPILNEQLVSAKVNVALDERVWAAFAGPVLELSGPGGVSSIACERLILCTGSTDRSLAIPGWTLPGVWSSRAIQILMHRDRVMPGRKFALLGSDPIVNEIADDIEMAGGHVVLTLSNPRDANIAISGTDHVESIQVDGRSIGVDAVIIAEGRLPDAQLAVMLECRATITPEPWCFQPTRNRVGETSVAGVFVAGDAAGVGSVELAWMDGARVGQEAAASLDDATKDTGIQNLQPGIGQFTQPWRPHPELDVP